MNKTPWYRRGLKFQCTQCGDCCTGAPGYVWVNKEEIANLARQMALGIDQFERLYVRRVGIRKSLKELPNGDCVLFCSDSRGCTVYEARPRQCRTWPFWSSNLRTQNAWRETCAICPGSGKGRLYTLAEIEQHRQRIRV